MPKLSKKHKEWPRIRYFKPRNNYVVDAGIKISPIDPKTRKKKRIREYYPTLEEAEVFAEKCRVKLKNEGLGGFSLTKEQQVDAEQALSVLNSKATLTQACEYFMRFNNLNESNKTINSLVEEFIDHKDKQRMLGEKGASERTINDYKHRLGLLCSEFGSKQINEFSEDTFLDWVLVRGDARGLTRTTKALFSFAVDKEYLPENPMRRKTPVSRIGKPSVLDDKHWRSLVLTALSTQNQKNSDRGQPVDLLASVTLGLWCGLRPEAELQRLDWSDINIDEGFVNIHDDWKVKIGRLVTIPNCAKDLLKNCKRKKGPIIDPKNFRRRWDWLRETAGVMDAWDSDIMRHTFASMHYGFYRDKQKVINELGHCNQSMLRHYVNHGAKMQKRAKEFFSFQAPSETKEDNLNCA